MSALPRARTWSTTNGHAVSAAATTAATTSAATKPASASASTFAPSPSTRSPTNSKASTTSISTEQKKHTTHVTTTTLTQHQSPQYQGVYASSRSRSSSSGTVDNEDPVVVAAPTFLQPRVAAVLGVSRRWHPILFALRLLSLVPGITLGFPLVIRFLLMLHAFATSYESSGNDDPLGSGRRSTGEDRLLLTETMLAIIWCGCSGYLSFYFTDCLMSRWLINYTPPATALRLVSVSALNGYLQSWTVYLSGSSQDPFLLLPTWVTITSTLTLVYHMIHRKINIRKEVSTSISVFSMASYVSLLALLVQQHWARADWLELPFVALACQIIRGGGEVVVRVAEYANITVVPRSSA